MRKLVVFSDPHMVPAGQEIVGIDPFARLRSGIRHVNRFHADADRVVILGDLAHDGSPRSYRRLRSLTQRLVMPLSLMVGNHDDRASFARIFPQAPRDANGFIQGAFDAAPYRAVLLDTILDPPHGPAPAASGQLCAARLGWLDRMLAEAGTAPVLLFMHHPPVAVGFPGMDAVRLIDSAGLLALVRRHGNVRHIFAGHVHRTISGSWHGVPFSIFKSPVHQQPMDLVSRDAALSVDEPAAYGILLLTESGVIVHTEDYEISGSKRSISD